MNKKKKILVISGDPNSINSEIIYKSWKRLNKSYRKKIYLISNYRLLTDQFRKLGYKTKIFQVKNLDERSNVDALKVININLNYINCFNVPVNSCRKFIKKSLNLAHNLSSNKNVIGIINCAINKNLLNKKNTGVTEFLATKCKIKDNSEVMLIWNKNFAVSPITTHLDVKNVSKKLNKRLIINKIKTIDKWFKNKFKVKPHIALLGLNPHNAEYRKNSEEIKIIVPAIKKLKKDKIKIVGPLVADTVFINEYKKYNVIVGMYHDQVLGPFKSLFKYDAINITLGLKYLRVSPDHGTANNLIGKNKANISSFLQCVKVVKKLG